MATDGWEIRALGPDDVGFLKRMLHAAIFVPDGEPEPDESIVDDPGLAHYVIGFGERFGDLGAIAHVGHEPVGACWLRLFPDDAPGYGFVAADVPELSIAVVEGRRDRGLGTELIESTLRMASEVDFELVSLSVDERSPALGLYERLGFEHVGWEGTSMTMVRPSLGF